MTTRPAFVVGFGAIVASMALGCADESTRFPWRVTFASGDLEARVAAYEAAIVRGGCAGDDAVYRASFGAGSAAATAPDRLSKGRYGFVVRALDAACATVAEGCEARDVPLDGPDDVVVELRASTAGARCAIDACAIGVCRAEPIDASMDAPMDAPIDAGAADVAPLDAQIDSAERDARMPCPDGGCTRVRVSDVVLAFDAGMGATEDQHRFVVGAPPPAYAIDTDEAFFAYATPCPTDTFELLVASREDAGASDWVYTVFAAERDALLGAGFRVEPSFVCVGSPEVPPAGTRAMLRFVHATRRHGSYRFVRDDQPAVRSALEDGGFTLDDTQTFVVWTTP